jgi:hypothetical protein
MGARRNLTGVAPVVAGTTSVAARELQPVEPLAALDRAHSDA